MRSPSRDARRVLEREHAVVQHQNLRASILISFPVAGVMSRFVDFLPLVLATGQLIISSVVWLIILNRADLIRPSEAEDLSTADAERLSMMAVGVNITGGIVWGLFVLLIMPDSVEGQLLIGWVVSAAIVVNMVEAAAVPRSFFGFHVPFTTICVGTFGLTADGAARWLAILIVALGLFTTLLANSLRDNAWQRAELALGNTQLIADLQAANRQLEFRSTHDALTGLLNRTALESAMERLRAGGGATPEPCAVYFIDLDHFKKINDTYGHHVGDDVIVTVSRRIHDAVPASALVCRIGGDEFVVVVPGMSLGSDAERLATALVRVVGEPIPDVNGCRLTASVGLSLLRRQSDNDPLEAIRLADAAMYQAKAMGGAQWTPVQLSPTPPSPAAYKLVPVSAESPMKPS